MTMSAPTFSVWKYAFQLSSQSSSRTVWHGMGCLAPLPIRLPAIVSTRVSKIAQASVEIFISRQVRLDRHTIRLCLGCDRTVVVQPLFKIALHGVRGLRSLTPDAPTSWNISAMTSVSSRARRDTDFRPFQSASSFS